jgi:hypothetical protein
MSPSGQVSWPVGLTSGPHAPNLWSEHHLTPPINNPVPPGRKCEESEV